MSEFEIDEILAAQLVDGTANLFLIPDEHADHVLATSSVLDGLRSFGGGEPVRRDSILAEFMHVDERGAALTLVPSDSDVDPTTTPLAVPADSGDIDGDGRRRAAILAIAAGIVIPLLLAVQLLLSGGPGTVVRTAPQPGEFFSAPDVPADPDAEPIASIAVEGEGPVVVTGTADVDFGRRGLRQRESERVASEQDNEAEIVLPDDAADDAADDARFREEPSAEVADPIEIVEPELRTPPQADASQPPVASQPSPSVSTPVPVTGAPPSGRGPTPQQPQADGPTESQPRDDTTTIVPKAPSGSDSPAADPAADTADDPATDPATDQVADPADGPDDAEGTVAANPAPATPSTKLPAAASVPELPALPELPNLADLANPSDGVDLPDLPDLSTLPNAGRFGCTSRPRVDCD